MKCSCGEKECQGEYTHEAEKAKPAAGILSTIEGLPAPVSKPLAFGQYFPYTELKKLDGSKTCNYCALMELEGLTGGCSEHPNCNTCLNVRFLFFRRHILARRIRGTEKVDSYEEYVVKCPDCLSMILKATEVTKAKRVEKEKSKRKRKRVIEEED